jgi:hypothetical protein
MRDRYEHAIVAKVTVDEIDAATTPVLATFARVNECRGGTEWQ